MSLVYLSFDGLMRKCNSNLVKTEDLFAGELVAPQKLP
jgi:hypothetical protein